MWFVQVTRVETAALASDMGSVSAKKGILELSVKVNIHNLNAHFPEICF